MIKTIKNFGALCAVESVVAVTFLVTVALCLHEGELIAALVAFGVAVGAVMLGVVRYRQRTRPVAQYVIADVTMPTVTAKPKRNRAKPAPVKPRPKRVKAKPKK